MTRHGLGFQGKQRSSLKALGAGVSHRSSPDPPKVSIPTATTTVEHLNSDGYFLLCIIRKIFGSLICEPTLSGESVTETSLSLHKKARPGFDLATNTNVTFENCYEI